MPEPDQSQSPSVAENRDGADRGVESAPEGAAEKASTKAPKKARAAKPAEPARNPPGSTSDVDESTLEPAPRIQQARLKAENKPTPVSGPSELDTLIDAETPPPRNRSASDVESGMDDLLEQQDEPEQDGDESSGGPSTVEGAGHPSSTAERTSSTQISPGDFEPSGLGSLRMALEGEAPPAEEPAEGAFQPLEDAALRIALAPNDAPTDGLSSSETLADVGDAGNRIAVHPGEQPVPADTAGDFSPSSDRDDRIPMPPADPAPDEGSPIESYGSPTLSSSDRMSVLPGPADDEGGSSVESYGSPTPSSDDRVPMWPDPAATAGPSPVESIGSPTPSADDRMSVLPGPVIEGDGGSPIESFGAPTSSSDDRVPMWPDPTANAGPSPVESIGSPTPSADDRMSIEPGSSVDQGINTVESYGSPSEDPSERIQLVPLPDIPGLGGVLEEYGTPAIESTERMGLWPFAPQGKPTSVAEEYGTPSRAGTDRVELHPKPDLEAAGNVLESYGEPSAFSDERVKLEPGSSVDADAESSLESAGDPSAAVRDRIDLLPGPDLDAAGNVLESYGTPSRNPGERTDIHPKPDLDAAGNVLESYGSPSRNPGERTEVYKQPDLDAAGNVLESYGSPSRDPGERTDIHPKPDLEAAGNVLENYGQPSDDADQRAPVVQGPDADQLASANVLESYGTPNVAAEDRIEVYEKPDYEAGNTMEPAGEPSDNAEARGPVSPEPDADTLDEARTLGLYGDPTRDRADRIELVDDRGFDPGDTLEGYGNPHRRRIQRMDLDPEPEVEPEFSTLKAIGKPFRDRAARIDLEEKPDIDPDSSTMSSAVRTSKDRTERVGRIDHEAALDEAALAASALRLSTDASDRMGYIDPFEPQSSPLPDVASHGILEAGRIAVSEADNKPRTSVPTGLEGLMPDQRLRGHDRMRLTEEEDYELPPELIGKIPVPPRVVQMVGHLAERDRITAAGNERVLQRETVHRRMDFLYQRYELLHVHRGYYHCPFAPEEPVFKNPEPRFVAGRIPLGNGMLAQLIASIYDDHSSISEQAGILDRLDFALAEEHIGTGLDNATLAMQPVMDALVAEAESGKGKPTVDKKGVDTNRPARRRRTAEGHFLFVSSATTRLLLHLDKGETHPLLKDAPPSRRKGELVRDLFRERVGYNRAGIWAGVRRRFTLALATSPREASYALFLIHAINVASASEQGQHDELVRRSRALRAWLDDQRDQFDDPDNPLQRSIVYALASWERMRFIDDAGDGAPVAEATARKFPKNYVPLWPFESDAEIRRATTWYSLVHTCRLLGIRPWEYLYDCFAALSKGPLDKPERWTPAAWARANRT